MSKHILDLSQPLLPQIAALTSQGINPVVAYEATASLRYKDDPRGVTTSYHGSREEAEFSARLWFWELLQNHNLVDAQAEPSAKSLALLFPCDAEGTPLKTRCFHWTDEPQDVLLASDPEDENSTGCLLADQGYYEAGFSVCPFLLSDLLKKRYREEA